MAAIRVLIADDHVLLRDGLRAALAPLEDIEVVGEASDGNEAVLLYPSLRPTVVLLDVEMPGLDGLETLEALRRLDPACRVVMLTSFLGDARVVRAMSLGAYGYLHKTSPKAFIIEAIRQAALGQSALSPVAAQQLAGHEPRTELHAREVACLELASRGLSTREIAQSLDVPLDTVKTRLKSAFAKLGVTDRVQAISVAIRRGYL